MRTNLKERAGRLARYVIRLDEIHQRHFISTLFECFSEKDRFKRLEWSATRYTPKAKGSRATTGWKKSLHRT